VSVQASPSTVPTQGQSTITASVIDPASNPVEGATVDFTLTDSTGGSLSATTAVTNAQGQVSVTYTASTISSAANGVTIEAVVEGPGIAPPANTANTMLTVGGQTVFLSLGTGNLITPYSSTQYEYPFTVQAVDAAGNGLSGVTITFTLLPVSYQEGFWHVPTGATQWAQSATAPAANPNAPPPSLDPLYVAGIGGCQPVSVYELNGQIQTASSTGITPFPPNPVPSSWVLTSIPGPVAATDVSSALTSTAGTATVNIIYPRDHAQWVSVALTATATVQGTQNSTTSTFWLPILATDVGTATVEPPGQESPYGQTVACYNNY
jgi:hypothetical protein